MYLIIKMNPLYDFKAKIKKNFFLLCAYKVAKTFHLATFADKFINI